jgi:formylglycine-generating enzyme
MNGLRKITAVPAVAACLLAGLYGCGGGSGSGASTTPAAPTASALVAVEGGTLSIGDNAVAKAAPAHDVTVSEFYLSKYELTFDEWDAYTKATGQPDLVDVNSAGRGSNPVYNISWYDAVEYCNWRSAQEGLTPVYSIDKTRKDPNNHATDVQDPKKWIVIANWSANGYRLPTEAEWEYAAKGGKLSKGFKFPGSNVLREVAWYGGKKAAAATLAGGAVLANFTTGTVTKKGDLRKVGSLKPNELGIYDMAGNVHEWVWDRYSSARTGTPATGYSTANTVNPKGTTTFNKFIYRGGNSGGPDTCMVPNKRFTKDVTFTMCPAGLRLARNK